MFCLNGKSVRDKVAQDRDALPQTFGCFLQPLTELVEARAGQVAQLDMLELAPHQLVWVDLRCIRRKGQKPHSCR